MTSTSRSASPTSPRVPTYQEQRAQCHNCEAFRVPTDIRCVAETNARSRFEDLPDEILLQVRRFLNFKDRCCLALTNKNVFGLVTEPCPQQKRLEVVNTERKQLQVHPANAKSVPSRHSWLFSPPAKIAIHVCGEYKELLRLLARDWDSETIRLCNKCYAWRPRVSEYWSRKAEDAIVSMHSTPQKYDLDRFEHDKFVANSTAWCEGTGIYCPDCALERLWDKIKDCDLISIQN